MNGAIDGVDGGAQWAVRFGPLQLGVWSPLDDGFGPALRWLDDTGVPSARLRTGLTHHPGLSRTHHPGLSTARLTASTVAVDGERCGWNGALDGVDGGGGRFGWNSVR